LRSISRLTLSSDVSSATPDLKLQWYPMVEKWKQVDEIGALRGHEFTGSRGSFARRNTSARARGQPIAFAYLIHQIFLVSLKQKVKRIKNALHVDYIECA
jgi:hypothetical protein